MKEKDIAFDYPTFRKIIDNLHDEIMVFDNNYQLVYLNKASYRHYGLGPEHFIGKHFSALDEVYWGNSTLPRVYKEKKTVAQRQITNLGADIVTISVPVFDENNDLEYVAMNVNDLYTLNELHNAEKTSIDISYPLSAQDEYIYTSDVMNEIMETIKRLSSAKSPCLILGETGTGKTQLAKYLHSISSRKEGPFVSINCACMNPNLIESELFGYKSGAFSGANKEGKKGLVEVANGGTLFLDEISEIPFDLQGKFLQLLQEQEFIPLGSEKNVKVDIRIIAATNRSLEQLVATKSFRQDLYFRLNVFEITIPPLRERKEDIKELLYYFLNQHNKTYNQGHVFSEETIKVLTNYSWPGNIRELSHLVEKLVLLTPEKEITPQDLPKDIFQLKSVEPITKTANKSMDELLEELEKQLVMNSYNKYKNSVKVAKDLKISQPRAYRLIKKYLNK